MIPTHTHTHTPPLRPSNTFRVKHNPAPTKRRTTDTQPLNTKHLPVHHTHTHTHTHTTYRHTHTHTHTPHTFPSLPFPLPTHVNTLRLSTAVPLPFTPNTAHKRAPPRWH